MKNNLTEKLKIHIPKPHMDKNNKIQELKKAIRAEKNIRIRNRMRAVLKVLKGNSTKIAVDFVGVHLRTVHTWMVRFDKRGIDGLRDMPKSGRNPLASYDAIKEIIAEQSDANVLTTRNLADCIYDRHNVRYNMGSLRKIRARFRTA